MSDVLISTREFVSRNYLQAIAVSPELYLLCEKSSVC